MQVLGIHGPEILGDETDKARDIQYRLGLWRLDSARHTLCSLTPTFRELGYALEARGSHACRAFPSTFQFADVN